MFRLYQINRIISLFILIIYCNNSESVLGFRQNKNSEIGENMNRKYNSQKKINNHNIKTHRHLSVSFSFYFNQVLV